MDEMTEFEKELQSLLNRFSMENGSNTPDYVLAQFLSNCLNAWNQGIKARESWFGRDFAPGQVWSE